MVESGVDAYWTYDEKTDNSKYVEVRKDVVEERHRDDGECIDNYHRARKPERESDVSSVPYSEVVPASKDQFAEFHRSFDYSFYFP